LLAKGVDFLRSDNTGMTAWPACSRRGDAVSESKKGGDVNAG
jgi:hypothetical protein